MSKCKVTVQGELPVTVHIGTPGNDLDLSLSVPFRLAGVVDLPVDGRTSGFTAAMAAVHDTLARLSLPEGVTIRAGDRIAFFSSTEEPTP